MTLDALLKSIATELAPAAADVRLGKTRALRAEVRTWQTGLCWSFAAGVSAWLREAGLEASANAAIWVVDPDYETYPVHVLCRAPSGILLDSIGVWQPESAARFQAEQFFDDADAPAWVEESNAFALRQGGIYPPREPLVEAVAAALRSRADASSFVYPDGHPFTHEMLKELGRGDW